MKAFLHHRWRRFTHPLGRRRIWHPSQWRWNERILVTGEAISSVSAVMAVASELLNWHGTNWFLLATPIVGFFVPRVVRLGHRLQTGDRPLTTTGIHNIRQVVPGNDAGRCGPPSSTGSTQTNTARSPCVSNRLLPVIARPTLWELNQRTPNKKDRQQQAVLTRVFLINGRGGQI